jgi:hypothetical protein
MKPSRSRRARAGLWAAAVATTFLIAGCKHTMGSYSRSSRVKQLNTVAEDYNKFIRWQEWDRASEFVRPEDQSLFREKLEEAEETFRITEFEIRDTAIDAESKSATVRVLYRYYRAPSVTEKKLVVRQRWTWSEAASAWYLDDPLAFLSFSSKASRRAIARSASEPGSAEE